LSSKVKRNEREILLGQLVGGKATSVLWVRIGIEEMKVGFSTAVTVMG
jgi:hypothetical protein